MNAITGWDDLGHVIETGRVRAPVYVSSTAGSGKRRAGFSISVRPDAPELRGGFDASKRYAVQLGTGEHAGKLRLIDAKDGVKPWAATRFAGRANVAWAMTFFDVALVLGLAVRNAPTPVTILSTCPLTFKLPAWALDRAPERYRPGQATPPGAVPLAAAPVAPPAPVQAAPARPVPATTGRVAAPAPASPPAAPARPVEAPAAAVEAVEAAFDVVERWAVERGLAFVAADNLPAVNAKRRALGLPPFALRFGPGRRR